TQPKQPRRTPAMLEVLNALLTGQNATHGYAIAQGLRRPSGTVVPILARLERLGWATSFWEPAATAARGARRRLYQLTPEGTAGARAMLEGHSGPPASPDRPSAAEQIAQSS